MAAKDCVHAWTDWYFSPPQDAVIRACTRCRQGETARHAAERIWRAVGQQMPPLDPIGFAELPITARSDYMVGLLHFVISHEVAYLAQSPDPFSLAEDLTDINDFEITEPKDQDHHDQ